MARLNPGLEEGDFCYIIKRIRYADSEPIALETIYCPVKLVPGLEKSDLEHNSFYRIPDEEYGADFSYDKKVISAVMADEETAKALYGKDSCLALKIIDVLYKEGIVNDFLLFFRSTYTGYPQTAIILYTGKPEALAPAICTEVICGNYGTAAALSTIFTISAMLSLLIFMDFFKSKDIPT